MDLCFQEETFLPPGYPATSLEGEMPTSFSSSGNTFKYSQTLQARRLNLSVDGRFVGIHSIGVRAVGWQRNMTIIGSPDSCLTSNSARTGPSYSDALIHTQMLIAMHCCPDQFELHSGDHLLMPCRSSVYHFRGPAVKVICWLCKMAYKWPFFLWSQE